MEACLVCERAGGATLALDALLGRRLCPGCAGAVAALALAGPPGAVAAIWPGAAGLSADVQQSFADGSYQPPDAGEAWDRARGRWTAEPRPSPETEARYLAQGLEELSRPRPGPLALGIYLGPRAAGAAERGLPLGPFVLLAAARLLTLEAPPEQYEGALRTLLGPPLAGPDTLARLRARLFPG